jgi:ribosomal protein L40E
VSTVYDVIPKILLKQLILWLEAFNLVAVWYYLAIALAVGASIFIVYIFQKRLFSSEKMIGRRIDHDQCMECGKSLRPGAHFCWHCGVSLLKECGSCHLKTPTSSKYCVECGSPQQ